MSSHNELFHKAAVLHGAKDLRIERIETQPVGPNEVQIAPRATGICGTDLHYYANGKNGIFVVEEPLVLGHEAAGEVVAVGKDVQHVRIGDRVAVEPQRPCMEFCSQCRRGKYNLCPGLKFTGSASAKPPVQGSLQQLYNHPAGFVYSLPDHVSYQEGAIIEPLSVAIHAVRRSGLHAGQSVLVVGAGAIGLLCASVARVSGASTIAMIDVDQARLDFAAANGYADAIFAVPLSAGEQESKAEFAARMAKESRETPGFDSVDVAFECTGVEVCANICIHSSAPGGKVVIVGMGAPLQSLNIGAAAIREVDIIAVWRYANTFPTAIEFLRARRIDVKALITHQFDLEKADEALELVMKKPPELVKCVITSDWRGR